MNTTMIGIFTAALLASSVFAEAKQTKETTRTYVFVCDNQSSYSVRTTAPEAWLFRPEGTLRLPSTRPPEPRVGMRGS